MAGLAKVPDRPPRSSPQARGVWGRNFVVAAVVSADEGSFSENPVPRRFYFSDEQRHTIGWDAGCNGFGGDVRFSATKMKVTKVSQTLVGCVPEELEEERWFSAFLAAEPEWRIHGRSLRLVAGGDTVVLWGYEDPRLCPIGLTGGRVDTGNTYVSCDGGLEYAVFAAEGEDRFLRGWKCRGGGPAGDGYRLVCRQGEHWFAVEGYVPRVALTQYRTTW